MKSTMRTTTVCGEKFNVWSDYIERATFAQNAETGETRVIRDGGYLSNDLSTRKAIAMTFRLPTFRK